MSTFTPFPSAPVPGSDADGNQPDTISFTQVDFSLVSGRPMPNAEGYHTSTGCVVAEQKTEPYGDAGPIKWRILISHNDRYPTWDEVKQARYTLAPDEVSMYMCLPPRAEYINDNTHCFQLWGYEERHEVKA